MSTQPAAVSDVSTDSQTHRVIPCLNRPVCRFVMGSAFPGIGDQNHVNAMFDAYAERGGNAIDTARVYAGGKSEKAVGEWLKTSGKRSDMVIIMKGAHHSGHVRRVSPQAIRDDLMVSLDGLQTDYADLLVLHRDDPDVPVGEIVDCLNDLRSEGLIRGFGGSNWSTSRLEDAAMWAAVNGKIGMNVSSPNLALAPQAEPVWANCLDACSLRDRQWYARTGMPLLAWSSLARGFFAMPLIENIDRMSREERDQLFSDQPHLRDTVRCYYTEQNFERHRRANAMAAELEINSTQLALAWVLNQPLNVWALCAPRNEDELAGLFDALSVELTPGELAWLNLEA